MKEFKYKINGSPYKVVINKSDDETVELEVNGTPYTVELTPKNSKPKTVVQRHTIEPAQSAPVAVVNRPKSSGVKKSIQSPLPGVILDIRCKVGDTVKKGQTLTILEAMKMENNILSDGDGIIKEILVQKGDSVLEGAGLVVIE